MGISYKKSDGTWSILDVPVTVINGASDGLANKLIDGSIEEIKAEDLVEITKIGPSAFRQRTKLVNVEIPDNITYIGNYAFRDCDALLTLAIPDSVKTVGAYAFAYCDSLESINIPDSVTSLGDYTFYGSAALKDVTIGKNVPSIGPGVLVNCTALETLTIPYVGNTPDSYSDTTKNFFGYIFGGSSHSYNGSVIPSTLKTLIITEPIDIYRDNFYNCPFETLVLPEGLTKTGAWICKSCKNLKNVTLPSTLTEITAGAFSSCSALEYIDIPAKVTTIGIDAFSYCSSLKEFTFPSGVKTITNSCFQYDSKLKKVFIPKSVTKIDERAFNGCTALTDIYYEGTSSQWSAISKSTSYNAPLTSATKHYECGGIE